MLIKRWLLLSFVMAVTGLIVSLVFSVVGSFPCTHRCFQTYGIRQCEDESIPAAAVENPDCMGPYYCGPRVPDRCKKLTFLSHTIIFEPECILTIAGRPVLRLQHVTGARFDCDDNGT